MTVEGAERGGLEPAGLHRYTEVVAAHLSRIERGQAVPTGHCRGVGTVRTHLVHVFATVGISSRTELVAAAIRKGLA